MFLSYNFEANYNSPFQGADYIPGPLDRVCTLYILIVTFILNKRRIKPIFILQLDLVRSFGSESTSSKPESESIVKNSESDSEIATENEQNEETTTSTESLRSSKARRSLVTRTNLYKSIERKLNA